MFFWSVRTTHTPITITKPITVNRMKKVLGVIPARYESKRFPHKVLAKINGYPLIYHTYQQSKKSKLISEVIIATDSEIVFDSCRKYNLNVMMTSTNHQSGTDRVIEVMSKTDSEIYVNIQGDEPLIKPEMIDQCIQPFLDNKNAEISTLKKKIINSKDVNNPNIVKVITSIDDNALYFSRSPIPFNRDGISDADYYKHVGIYCYSKTALRKISQLKISKLERIEKLEQLRFLENCLKITVIETTFESIGVDTVEDLELVRKLMNNNS